MNILSRATTDRPVIRIVDFESSFERARHLDGEFYSPPTTPGYSAPEVSHQAPDARSDLFSLGAVLYTLLAGYRWTDHLDVRARVAADHVLDTELKEVLLAAVDPVPDKRYASVQLFQTALGTYLERIWPGDPGSAMTNRGETKIVLGSVACSSHQEPKRKMHMHKLAIAALSLALLPAGADAQVNAGEQKPEASLPFTMTQVATFNLPWRIAFLPDGRMLITEKPGRVWLVTQAGRQDAGRERAGRPVPGPGRHARRVPVAELRHRPQRLPHLFGTGRRRIEPRAGARASSRSAEAPRVSTDCRSSGAQMPKGKGGQFGAADRVLARQAVSVSDGRRSAAHDARAGSQSAARQDPAPDARRQTRAGQSAGRQDRRGDARRSSIRRATPKWRRPRRSSAPTRSPDRTSTPSETWTTGHRTPYGLAFAPDGRLWELEHGPRGGDELNLIEPGKNYGWPLVSYATNYDGVPIPSPDTRPDLAKPVIYWTPVIAPGNMMFYKGAMFPQWNGSR